MVTVYCEINGSTTIILCNGCTKIGSINYREYEKEDDKKIIYVNELDILEKERGKGYGKVLVNALIDEIKQVMKENIIIELTASVVSKGFWEKLGFVVVYTNHQLVYKYVMQLLLYR